MDQSLPPGPTDDLFLLRLKSGQTAYEWSRPKTEGKDIYIGNQVASIQIIHTSVNVIYMR